MSDVPETDSEGQAGAEAVDTPATTRRRGLDGRMIAVVVCVALVGAIATALIVSAVVNKNGGDTTANLSSPGSAQVDLSPKNVDGPKLAKITLLTVAGKNTTLAAALGKKPALVNLWSESCGPCIDEMPLLEQVHKGDDRVGVIGVNTDTKRQLRAAERLATRTGITYPWVRDPSGSFVDAAKVAGLPTTLLVGPDGTVLAAQTGVFHDKSELKSWLDRNLP